MTNVQDKNSLSRRFSEKENYYVWVIGFNYTNTSTSYDNCANAHKHTYRQQQFQVKWEKITSCNYSIHKKIKMNLRKNKK